MPVEGDTIEGAVDTLTSPDAVVMPDNNPAVPIVKLLALTKLKLFPTPVTLAATVLTRLDSPKLTDPPASMLNCEAVMIPVCVVVPAAVVTPNPPVPKVDVPKTSPLDSRSVPFPLFVLSETAPQKLLSESVSVIVLSALNVAMPVFTTPPEA